MSFGIQEITLILIVVLLLFGGKRIPELARAKETIKKETDELKETVKEEIEK